MLTALSFFCLLLCLAAGFGQTASTNTPVVQSRIIGGAITSIKNARFLVQVISAETLCGGSLVTSSWVITAAHCIEGLRPLNLRIYGGASNVEGPYAVLRYVDYMTKHPKFNPTTLHMDVAALRLVTPMQGLLIETIPLATSVPQPRSVVRVYGWGVLKRDSTRLAKRVHTTKIPIWSRLACKKSYKGQRLISKSMICAGKPQKRDSCTGDSGGPLIYDDQLVGIVSWGIGCATNQPGVYTSVPVIRSWFLNIVKLHSHVLA